MEKNADSLNFLVQQTHRLEGAYCDLHDRFALLQQKLEASRDTLEQIVTHLADGLVFLSCAGIITLFNPAASVILEVPQEEALGAFVWDHFPDEVFGFSLRGALESRPLLHRVWITFHGQEKLRELEITVSTIPERGILLFLRDRSDLKRLEESLGRAERLKEIGEMAASLAHEIRNPLGGIEGFASLLKRELVAPAHQQMLAAILEGTRCLNRLVSHVLEYTRPCHLHIAPIDFVALIRETLALLAQDPLARPSTFDTPHTTYSLFADKGRLMGALMNVLRNAFESHASRIELLLDQEGVLHIRDNGTGIAPDNLKKIFTPFFTTKEAGNGLGLADAHKVIEAHGGTLNVCSQLGKGTTFIFKLPSHHEN